MTNYSLVIGYCLLSRDSVICIVKSINDNQSVYVEEPYCVDVRCIEVIKMSHEGVCENSKIIKTALLIKRNEPIPCINITPRSEVEGSTPIEFNIAGTDDQYVDLKNAKLNLTFKAPKISGIF